MRTSVRLGRAAGMRPRLLVAAAISACVLVLSGDIADAQNQGAGGAAGAPVAAPPVVRQTLQCEIKKSRAIARECASRCQDFYICPGQPKVPLNCAPPPC